MFSSKKTNMVFEVGENSVKLVNAELSKNKIKVLDYALIPLENKEMQKSNLPEEDKIAELITDTLKNKKIKNVKSCRKVAIASGEGIITRDILMQKVSIKELDKVIKYEAERYFPVDLSNYKLDYKLLADVETSEGIKSRVYIVAVPVKIIQNYVKISEKCKFMLDAVDISSNTLSKIIIHEMKARNESIDTIIGIDVGAASTQVVFINNSVLEFNREVKFGRYEIVNVISNYLGFERSKVVENYDSLISNCLFTDENSNSADEETKSMAKDIGKIFKLFAEDVSRIIEFYRSRYSPGSSIKIIITGASADAPKIEEVLSKLTEIECLTVNEFTCLDGKSKDGFISKSSQFANLLGALI